MSLEILHKKNTNKIIINLNIHWFETRRICRKEDQFAGLSSIFFISGRNLSQCVTKDSWDLEKEIINNILILERFY